MTQGFGARGTMPERVERQPWEVRHEAAARRAAKRKRNTFGGPKADPAPFGRLGRAGWCASAIGLTGGPLALCSFVALIRAWRNAGSLQGISDSAVGGFRPSLALGLIAENPQVFTGIGLILAGLLTVQFARRLCDAGKRFEFALGLHVASLATAFALGCLPYGILMASLVVVVLYLWALLLNPVEPA